ncbi:hypothetical protein Q8F55_003486 [Vanrija albida]|uniref:BTB domain-containing protein n=1 Tax=Vanrija albida TaxID=181172 RepID=A0ABR3Q561_9TREE
MPGPLSPPSKTPSPLASPIKKHNSLGALGLSSLTLNPSPSVSVSPLPSPGPLQPPLPRSPLQAPASLAPPSNEDPKYKTGDFVIVSSDNIKFKIQSYHLFSASSEVAAATDEEGVPLPRQIHFTDDDIESALVIRAFLRVITTGQVATTPDGTGTPSVSALRRLILFLRKYECPVALNLVLFKVKELLNQGISVPMYTFILGATADDVDTCALALKFMNQSWNGPSGYTDVRNEGTPGASTIDPNNLPFALWQWIPSEYMWALSRAWGRNVKDGTRLPDEFKRVIAIVKGVDGKNSLPL